MHCWWGVISCSYCGKQYGGFSENWKQNYCMTQRFHSWVVVVFSRQVVSSSVWPPHGLQHTRAPCPSLSPGVYSNSGPLSQWCHPTISSSVIPFSSCLQSFPASGSFPKSWFLFHFWVCSWKKKQKNPLIWKDTCTPELIPALFTVAKIRKQPAWLPHLMLLTTLGWALVFPAFCRWRHGLREAGGLSGAGRKWGSRLGIPTGACAPPRWSCAPAVVSGSHRWDATSLRRHHAGAPCLVTWLSSNTYQAPVLALGQSR